ncbi:MAG TPA: carboxypeptidase regulatory-like domain-containing protein [Bryobacteraceae bacterium]|nr:carboxypeptidase regulatory-like domain-containing protein [Bryobacteraceae bacterium]
MKCWMAASAGLEGRRAAQLLALSLLANLAASRPGEGIQGRVLDGESGEGVAQATVRLLTWPEREETAAAVTDAAGRFSFDGVAPGRYVLAAVKAGYLHLVPQTSPARVLTLPAQNREGEVLTLVRSAVIAGRILDARGQPSGGVRVTALVRRAGPGGVVFVPSGRPALTNDEGAYRIWGLPPGWYTVAVTGSLERGLEGTFPPAYYPGTLSIQEARFFRLKPGETRSGTDLWLAPAGPSVELKGVVTGIPAEWGARPVLVFLAAKDGLAAAAQVTQAGSDGRFVFRQVRAGAYVVLAIGPVAGRGPFGPLTGAGARQGRREVEVGAGDPIEVEVALSDPVTLEGQVRFERPSEIGLTCHTGAEVILAPGGFAPQGRPFTSRISAEGRFRIEAVFPGNYHLSVRGFAEGCYLKDVLYGGGAVREGFLNIEGGAGTRSVTLVLASRGATVDGIVRGPDGKPAAGAAVALVRRGDLAGFDSHVVTADAAGRYKLEGIPPGPYRLLALARVVSEEYLDPLFWQEEGGGFDITLEPGSITTADLRLRR